MRKYLFKAKRKDNNEWVEGFYYERLINNCYILSPKNKNQKKKWTECDIKGKTVLVGLDDTDFTFVFNKDKNYVLSTYDWYRGLG